MGKNIFMPQSGRPVQSTPVERISANIASALFYPIITEIHGDTYTHLTPKPGGNQAEDPRPVCCDRFGLDRG